MRPIVSTRPKRSPYAFTLMDGTIPTSTWCSAKSTGAKGRNWKWSTSWNSLLRKRHRVHFGKRQKGYWLYGNLDAAISSRAVLSRTAVSPSTPLRGPRDQSEESSLQPAEGREQFVR